MSIYNSTENLWNKNRNKTLHENYLCQNIHIQTSATQLWGGGCSELGLKGWDKSLTSALVPEDKSLTYDARSAWIGLWVDLDMHSTKRSSESNPTMVGWNNTNSNIAIMQSTIIKNVLFIFSKLVSGVKEMKGRSMQTYSAKTQNVVFIHCFAPLLHLKYLFIRQCKFASYSDCIH